MVECEGGGGIFFHSKYKSLPVEMAMVHLRFILGIAGFKRSEVSNIVRLRIATPEVRRKWLA